MNNLELIKEAKEVLNPLRIGDDCVGDVGAAILTSDGNVFKGVSVDFGSGLGCCAERIALGNMFTNKSYKIKKVVAVWNNNPKKELFVLPPCGACRHYMYNIVEDGGDIEVVLSASKSVKLKDLLPLGGWDVEKVNI